VSHLRVVEPRAESDAATTRWFERWLERQNPGTVWQVVGEGDEDGLLPVTARRQIVGAHAARVHDETIGLAA
jgi:hypothetical protein